MSTNRDRLDKHQQLIVYSQTIGKAIADKESCVHSFFIHFKILYEQWAI